MNARLLFVLGYALVHNAAAAAEALPGRLFFTAAERRALEYARQHPPLQTSPPTSPQSPLDIAQPPAGFRFDGMVWREDRLIALWIDRQPAAADRFRRPDFARAQLRFTDPAGRLIRLDAGQGWTPTPEAPTSTPLRITSGVVMPTQ